MLEVLGELFGRALDVGDIGVGCGEGVVGSCEVVCVVETCAVSGGLDEVTLSGVEVFTSLISSTVDAAPEVFTCLTVE